MPSPAELQARLWTAFSMLDKPATVEAVRTTAAEILSGKELRGFNDWLDKNTEYLLGRINNG